MNNNQLNINDRFQLFENNFEKFKILSDNSFDIINILDKNGKILFESIATERILGYKAGERIGQVAFNFVHPDDMQSIAIEFEDLISIPKSHKIIEFRFQHKNGSWKWLEASGQNFLDNPHINGIIINSRDITERKNSEKKLIESEEKYRYLSENANDGIAFFENKILKYISSGFLQVLGYEKQEIENLDIDKIFSFFHPDDVKMYSEKMNEDFRNQLEKYTIEYRLRTKNNKYIWFENSVKAEYDNFGNHKRSIIYSRNIDERKKSEIIINEQNRKLKKLNDDKDTFMRILAHDLKNPFNSILGFSDLLLKNIHKYSLEKIESQVKIINQTSYQTYILLEDLLLWSKSQSGKLTFNPQNIDFKKICDELINNFNLSANSKNININCYKTIDKSLFADENMLKTIMRNLISNAIKFTNTNGIVTIYTEETENEVVVTVSDTGIGISENEQEKMWNLSHHFSKNGTNGETGTGLGLVLCKEFVEKHNGQIWVESEVGKGSDFKFTLPLCND